MNWIGKILGAIFGFLLLGAVGMIIGIIAGHFFDKGFKNLDWMNLNAGNNKEAQQAFFDTTFAVMGHVAKADGRVSERQIQLARKVMQRMGLHGERKLAAMRQFNKGKESSFRIREALNHLSQVCTSKQLLRIFIELQVQTAYADGTPSARVKNLLQHISQQLGMGPIDFAHVEAMLYGQWYQQQSQQHQYQRQQYYQPPPQQPRTSLSEAYDILGVNSSASDAEVKKAYRRKMNENHPDKLMAKGLPKEMIDVATEKTQQIKEAYEQIKKYRNIK